MRIEEPVAGLLPGLYQAVLKVVVNTYSGARRNAVRWLLVS